MERIVTAKEMRRLEAFVMDEVGIDAILLMERAALFAASRVKKRLAKACAGTFEEKIRKKILIVCGMGNNGADGLALARILAEDGYQPEVVLVGNREKRSDLNGKQEKLLKGILGENFTINTLTDTKNRQTEYSVIVDAVLGIGGNRELQGEIARAVEFMNGLSGYKLAMDIPTGVNSDTGNVTGIAFRADETVTFGLKKAGLLLNEGKQYAGKVKVNSCGIYYPFMVGQEATGQIFTFEEKDLKKYLVRSSQGNKSTFGKIGILAGSEKVGGAAILCARGAYRSGGGYLRLCTHVNNRDSILQCLPETVLDVYGNGEDAEADKKRIQELLAFSRVLCAGPGMGKSDRAARMLGELLCHISGTGKTLILDADALNLISEQERLKSSLCNDANLILTPHLLEFSRLCGLSVREIRENKIEVSRSYAREWGCTLVLKDARTVVADRHGNVFVNTTGNSGMAVAGSGDVLAGIIAGLQGQIKDPYIAACCGVYIHGMAGDITAKKMGAHSMLPTDFVENVKKCMKKLGKEAEENGTV